MNNIIAEALLNISVEVQDLQTNLPRNQPTANNLITHNQNFSSQSIVLHNLSVTNSLPSTPLGNTQPTKKCEYLRACSRFKKSLVLPEEFFSSDDVLCYCSSCCKLEDDSAICKKGEPLAEFAIPLGWVRFSLKQSINANQIPQSTIDKWHVAFYATRLEAIR